MVMMQGDSYNVPITVLNNAGNPVTPDEVINVEVVIGRIAKSFLRQELVFLNGKWMFPLSQTETFSIPPGAVKGQIRVKWANGVLEGRPLLGLRMTESESKEEL